VVLTQAGYTLFSLRKLGNMVTSGRVNILRVVYVFG
jgi:hypothetical protein